MILTLYDLAICHSFFEGRSMILYIHTLSMGVHMLM